MADRIVSRLSTDIRNLGRPAMLVHDDLFWDVLRPQYLELRLRHLASRGQIQPYLE
jgi:hypothetical protein